MLPRTICSDILHDPRQRTPVCRQMHSRKDFGTCSADRSMHTLGGNGAVHLTPGHWLRAESELREATDAIDEEAV